MTVAKITACIILIVMAGTWAAISCRLGVMISLSDNFMYLGGLLLSVVTGGGIGDFLVQKFQVKK